MVHEQLRAASGAALISEPTRAGMLRLILDAPEGRSTVTRLAAALGLRQPTVTHHAKALTEAGYLERRPEGRQAWYSVAPDRIDQVLETLGDEPERPLTGEVLDRIVDDLSERFTGTFARETVDRFVRESERLLTSGRMPRQLASRTATFAADRLAAVASRQRPAGSGGSGGSGGRDDAEASEVLFVCVQNAGRSQMAAAILRQLAGGRVHVRTAGSAPAASLSPAIVTVLDEVGVPLGGEFPKPLTDEVVRAADIVITMGCGDACPVYPGTRYLDWELDDPVGQPINRVRAIRDDIDRRVRELLASINP